MSKHNKKEESIFDKMEKMTGIPVMYLAIILAVVVVIVIIGILYMVDMLPQDMLNVLSSNVENALPDSDDTTKSELFPPPPSSPSPSPPPLPSSPPPLPSSPLPPPSPENMIMNGGNIKIFKKR